jgi:hypothetical protein
MCCAVTAILRFAGKVDINALVEQRKTLIRPALLIIHTELQIL